MHIRVYYYLNNVQIQIWFISEFRSVLSKNCNENLASDTYSHPNSNPKKTMNADMILPKIRPYSTVFIPNESGCVLHCHSKLGLKHLSNY